MLATTTTGRVQGWERRDDKTDDRDVVETVSFWAAEGRDDEVEGGPPPPRQ